MARIVASMNMTLDGYCDHTVMMADDEIHDHYTDLLKSAGAILYGRTTYQLMESYWPTLVKNPSGEKSSDDFAIAIENVPKVLFSRTVKSVTWANARLAKKSLEDEVKELKQKPGKDVFVGSPSLIAALTKLNLLDELQIGLQPVIAGSGLVLFKNITERIVLKHTKTKDFKQSGGMILYLEPTK